MSQVGVAAVATVAHVCCPTEHAADLPDTNTGACATDTVSVAQLDPTASAAVSASLAANQFCAVAAGVQYEGRMCVSPRTIEMLTSSGEQGATTRVPHTSRQ